MPRDPDFAGSGQKVPSVLRLSRLAVLDGTLLIGSIGSISDEPCPFARPRRGISQRLISWDPEERGDVGICSKIGFLP